MRAVRLVAALLVLQARGRVTAADLAEELEVSERTARRDGPPGILRDSAIGPPGGLFAEARTAPGPILLVSRFRLPPFE